MKTLYKRFLLVFLFVPFMFLIPGADFTKSIWFISFSAFSISISLLLNFPTIIHFLHGTTVSLEDLQHIESDEVIKHNFIILFEMSYAFFASPIIAAIIYYYLFQEDYTHLSKFELIGIIGGIISLSNKCQKIIGLVLLNLLNKYKKTVTSRRLSIIELKEIEAS